MDFSHFQSAYDRRKPAFSRYQARIPSHANNQFFLLLCNQNVCVFLRMRVLCRSLSIRLVPSKWKPYAWCMEIDCAMQIWWHSRLPSPRGRIFFCHPAEGGSPYPVLPLILTYERRNERNFEERAKAAEVAHNKTWSPFLAIEVQYLPSLFSRSISLFDSLGVESPWYGRDTRDASDGRANRTCVYGATWREQFSLRAVSYIALFRSESLSACAICWQQRAESLRLACGLSPVASWCRIVRAWLWMISSLKRSSL